MPPAPIDRPDRLLTIREIADRVHLSRSTILRREKAGEFPRRNPSVKRLARWAESTIDDFVAGRWKPTVDAI
jgi:predicted DNA-binding transcriptional regulator AlpA